MDKPNIIYILADDMGYGDLSCLNENSKVNTQNLDRMAYDGMIFRDAHSSSAVCTPSRYGILTGRYNWRSRLKQSVLRGYSPHLIEPGRMTVASYLKKHGYNTACIGKWHLGMDWTAPDGSPVAEPPDNECIGKSSFPEVDYSKKIKNSPVCNGFDYYFGISASLDMPPYTYIENDHVTAIPDRIIPEAPRGIKGFYRGGPIAPGFEHEKVTPELTEKACGYIREQAESSKPFFLYFPLPSPHLPILPGEFKGKSGTNDYGDFCLMVDWSVGEIINTLDEQGISDNTIVIFTSDNGCAPSADFKELSEFGHNPSYVFRGHKADIYEGGHRIPLLIKWPATIKSESITDETVCLNDLLATCAEIMGEKLPDDAGEDSVSNLSVWQGKELDRSVREATVHHSIYGNFSIRKGNWKLEMCPGSGGWSAPLPGDEPEDSPDIQLYDLSQDIGERRNLCNEFPGIVDELKALLIKYVKDGRSTPGQTQPNAEMNPWPGLEWLQC